MKLSELAEKLGADLRLIGTDSEVQQVAHPNMAGLDAVIFVEDEPALDAALASSAAAVILSAKLVEQAGTGKSLLVVRQPKLAFALAAKLLRTVEASPGVHPTAVVAESAVLGTDVSVEPYAVIEAEVRIGKGTRVGAGAVIGAGVTIGAVVRIYPRVVVYSGVEIGDRVVVHAGAVLGADGFGYVRDAASGAYTQFPQQGRLVIEDDVEIGANTTIDRGALEETRIARGVKIDNLVHLGHNVRVGKNVVIAAQTGVSGSTAIGEGAVIGGQVGIGDHAEVGPGVILGSQGGVLPHKKLKGPGVLFWGSPAKPVKQYLRELATLTKLSRTSKSEKE